MGESQLSPEEKRKRAMNDPEVVAILQDGAMQAILQQMQDDPKAVQEYVWGGGVIC